MALFFEVIDCNLSFIFLKHWDLNFLCMLLKRKHYDEHSTLVCLSKSFVSHVFILKCIAYHLKCPLFYQSDDQYFVLVTVAVKYASYTYCAARRPICIFDVCWLMKLRIKVDNHWCKFVPNATNTLTLTHLHALEIGKTFSKFKWKQKYKHSKWNVSKIERMEQKNVETFVVSHSKILPAESQH